jgi:hypothetical protein
VSYGGESLRARELCSAAHLVGGRGWRCHERRPWRRDATAVPLTARPAFFAGHSTLALGCVLSGCVPQRFVLTEPDAGSESADANRTDANEADGGTCDSTWHLEDLDELGSVYAVSSTGVEARIRQARDAPLIRYALRKPNNAWSPGTIDGDFSSIAAHVDRAGALHLVLGEQGALTYRAIASAGSASEPETIPEANAFARSFPLTHRDGTLVVIAWLASGDSVCTRNAGSNWSCVPIFASSDSLRSSEVLAASIDASDEVHLLLSTPEHLPLYMHGRDGNWSEPSSLDGDIRLGGLAAEADDVYVSYVALDSTRLTLAHRTHPAGEWQTAEVDTRVGLTELQHVFARRPQGGVLIAYRQNTWTLELQDRDESLGVVRHQAVSMNGNPISAFVDEGGIARVAFEDFENQPSRTRLATRRCP